MGSAGNAESSLVLQNSMNLVKSALKARMVVGAYAPSIFSIVLFNNTVALVFIRILSFMSFSPLIDTICIIIEIFSIDYK